MAEQIIEPLRDLQIQDSTNNIYDDDDDDELSYHHKVPNAIDGLDWHDMTTLINSLDSNPNMTDDECRMAQQQKHLILYSRLQLIRKRNIMRASYKGYAFRTYSSNEFYEKSSTYIKTTGIYQMISTVNPKNPEISHRYLHQMLHDVETTLTQLVRSKFITHEQFALMHPKRSIIRFNYLHFVPDTLRATEPLQPIIICKYGPTWNIVCYLSKILWSMFSDLTGCRKFINADDIVYTMEQYVKGGFLRHTTSFIQLNINEICLKFSHEAAIKALETFLHRYFDRVQAIAQGLSIEAILELARLVLRNQYFIYENALYQQIYGSASGSLLTIPLVCIHLFYGQSSSFIEKFMNVKNEIIGRYRDDFVFTWNESTVECQTSLNALIIQQQHHPNLNLLSLPIVIGSKVRLLDLELKQIDGRLITKIYHDPMADEYNLPNVSDYHTSQPAQLLKAAFQHAALCCINEKDFHEECSHIETAYIVSGFSLDFIKQAIHGFFNDFPVRLDEVRGTDQTLYDTLRKHILNRFEERLTLKKQREQQRTEKRQQLQQQKIIYMPCPSECQAQSIMANKNDFLNILKSSLTDELTFNDIQFESIARPQTPMTINDYLVNKRPPLSLLTLPRSE